MGSVLEEMPISSLDPAWTEMVVNSMGPKTSPRLREIMASLIRHSHEIVKETGLTSEEWQIGMKFMNLIGQKSTALVNEMQIVMDVLGIETIVDEVTSNKLTETRPGVTPMAVLGPFYKVDAPARAKGESMIQNDPNGEPVYMYGKVLDCVTGKPVPHAKIQFWEASTNGIYSQQDPKQELDNLHGKYETDENGEYALYCIKPTPYPIDPNAPAATLLDWTDRHHWRPAHIHAYIEHKDFARLITQLYDHDDPYLTTDATCAVVNPLVVKFLPRKGDPQAKLEFEYNFVVAPRKA